MAVQFDNAYFDRYYCYILHLAQHSDNEKDGAAKLSGNVDIRQFVMGYGGEHLVYIIRSSCIVLI